MNCPTVKELPPVPKQKKGWPWNKGSTRLSDDMFDIIPWPKITIITPSYNQGDYIEEAIRSVLLQGYPNIEYIIIDGGSDDKTVDIIRKYENWISFWVSEVDKGQCNAINKGIEKSTGKIIGWLNSDDVYCRNIFEFVVKAMWRKDELKNRFLYGNCIVIDENGKELSRTYGKPNDYEDVLKVWRGNYSIPQPGSFFEGELLRQTLLNESLHYVLDWELFIRLSAKTRLFYVDKMLAKFRHHIDSKSVSSWVAFIKERRQVLENFFLPQNRLYIVPIRSMYFTWLISYYYHNYFLKKVKALFITLGIYRTIKKLQMFIKAKT